MRRTSAVLLAGGVVLATACPPSPRPVPTDIPATHHFTHPPARPARCPAGFPSRHRFSVTGNEETLVPDTPFATVVCVYAFPASSAPPNRVVLGSVRTKALSSLLDAAKKVATTEVVACPNEDTTPVALFFDYTDGAMQLVSAATSGCLFASNGKFSVYESPAVLHVLKRLGATRD